MMTPEQQRIAIAEWMGFDMSSWHKQCIVNGKMWDANKKLVPDYPNDLNAMQSAVLAQDKTFIREFDESLEELAIERGCCICELLAADWATIFLQCKRG